MKIAKKHLLSFVILFALFLAQFLLINNMNVKIARADENLWNTVSEGGLGEIGEGAYGSEKPAYDVKIIIVNLVKVFLGFLGIIFLIIIIMAGYKWMMSGGSEEKINEAKSEIIRGIIGLAIIIAAYSITLFITDEIRKATTGEVW